MAEVAKAFLEITASGNVLDFHLVPFSSSVLIGKEETLTGAKVGKKTTCNKNEKTDAYNLSRKGKDLMDIP